MQMKNSSKCFGCKFRMLSIILYSIITFAPFFKFVRKFFYSRSHSNWRNTNSNTNFDSLSIWSVLKVIACCSYCCSRYRIHRIVSVYFYPFFAWISQFATLNTVCIIVNSVCKTKSLETMCIYRFVRVTRRLVFARRFEYMYGMLFSRLHCTTLSRSRSKHT